MGNEQSRLRSKDAGSKNEKVVTSNAENVKYAYNTVDKAPKPVKNETPVNLLVISSHVDENFYDLFKGRKLANGRPIVVEQRGWEAITMTTYTDSGCVCTLGRPRRAIPDTPQNQIRTFLPNFLLVRNVVRMLRAEGDKRNILYGFMVGQIPSVNTLMSIFLNTERPLMVAELLRLNKLYGQKQFPIISGAYYPVSEEMIVTPEYPLVVKIGHADAGFGKMKLDNHRQFGDLKSIVATTEMYCTAERYIEGKCDLRLQKIGNHYSAFKRVSVSGNWKTNTGTAMIEFIELLPRYKFWLDQCSQCFGGMDICTVDVLVAEKDESEYIMEFNATASGFGKKIDDNLVLVEHTINRMNEHFCPDLVEHKIDATDADAPALSSGAVNDAMDEMKEQPLDTSPAVEQVIPQLPPTESNPETEPDNIDHDS